MRKTLNRGSVVRRAARTVLESLESRRLLSAGSLDLTFGSGGIVKTDYPGPNADFASAAAQDGAGFVVVGQTQGAAVMAKYTATGQRDTSFGHSGEVLLGGSVLTDAVAVAVDGSGNIDVAGDQNGQPAIARFTSSGALDTSFGNSGVMVVPSAGTLVTGLTFDSQNRIVASVTGSGDLAAIRLTPAGQPDTTFNGTGVATADFGATDIANGVTIANDSIAIVGATGDDPSNRQVAVAEFNPDGTPNDDFNNDGQYQRDIQLAGGGDDDVANTVMANNLGQLIIGVTSGTDFILMRLDANGTEDTSFGEQAGFTVTNIQTVGQSNDAVTSMGIDGSGNIILAGSSDGKFALVGYTSQGLHNDTFGVQTRDFGGNSGITSVLVSNDGSVRAIGSAPGAGGFDFTFLGLTSSGQNDPAFGSGGVATDGFIGPQGNEGNAIAEQSDGKLVAVGEVNTPAGPAVSVTRYLPNGALDTSFGTNGLATFSAESSDIAKGVAIGADGSIYVGIDANSEDGSTDDFAVAKFTPSGALDRSFNSTGYLRITTPDTNDALTAIALSGGNIYLAGTQTTSDGNDNFELAEVSADGSVVFGDPSHTVSVDFNNDSIDGFSQDDLSGMAIDSSGNVILSGSSFNGSDPDVAVARLTSNGDLDTSFGNGGMVIENISLDQAGPVAVDSLGNVYVAAFELDLNSGDNSTAVFKLDSTGALDQSFGTNGLAEMSIGNDGAFPVGIGVGSDGAITVAANASDDDGNTHFAIARFDSTGNADSTFGSGGSTIINIGTSDTASGMIVQSDGNPVIVGTTDSIEQAVARFDGGQTVVVTPPPVADAGPDQTVNEGATVHFDGSASTGDGITYAWDLDGDGSFNDATVPTASFTYPDDGTITVSLQVTDSEGRSSTDTLTVTVNNVAPTLTVTGTGSANEGSVYSVNLGSNDPGADTISSWTINWGDGHTDVISGNPNSASHTYVDNGSYTILSSATDEDGTYAGPNSSVVVANVAPTASISGSSSLMPGQSGTFTLGATDPSSVDQAGNFTFKIDWDGNGTVDQTVVGPAGTTVSHSFTTEGSDTVKVTATDKDGGQSASASTNVSINAPTTVTATQQPDPLNSGQTMLIVQGTDGNDVIELDHSQQKVNKVLVQTLTVTSNGVAIFSSTTPFSRIQVFANSGDDSVTHGGGFKYAVEEYGGAGNDTLKAGQSGDILVGGAGDDSLVSGAGNDLEIGGVGADKVVGDAGQDILIAGTTAYDNDPASLDAISAEWTSTRSFASRVANLQGNNPNSADFAARLNGNVFLIADASNATVFDDGVKDTLNGGGKDVDWLLYNITGGTVDKAAGNTTGDILQDIS